MKYAIIFAFLLFSVVSVAQDTSKVEQYCTVIATPRLLSTKVTIDIDYGEERKLWSDNRLKDDAGRLKKFNTVVDALNYMGKMGWKLVNAFPVSTSANSYIYHYIFRKEFNLSETNQQ